MCPTTRPKLVQSAFGRQGKQRLTDLRAIRNGHALDAWLELRDRDAGALCGRAVRGGRGGERRLAAEIHSSALSPHHTPAISNIPARLRSTGRCWHHPLGPIEGWRHPRTCSLACGCHFLLGICPTLWTDL